MDRRVHEVPAVVCAEAEAVGATAWREGLPALVRGVEREVGLQPVAAEMPAAAEAVAGLGAGSRWVG